MRGSYVNKALDSAMRRDEQAEGISSYIRCFTENSDSVSKLTCGIIVADTKTSEKRRRTHIAQTAAVITSSPYKAEHKKSASVIVTTQEKARNSTVGRTASNSPNQQNSL